MQFCYLFRGIELVVGLAVVGLITLSSSVVSAQVPASEIEIPVPKPLDEIPEIPAPPNLDLDELEAALEGTESIARLEALSALLTAYRRRAPHKGLAYGDEVEELLASFPENEMALAPPSVNRMLTDLSDMAFMTGDFEATVHWAQRALEEAEQANYQAGIGQALWREAVIQGMNMEFDEGLATLERARIVAEALRDPSLLAAYYSALSVVYSYKGRLLDASEAQAANLEWARRGEDSSQLGLALVNMGIEELGADRPEVAETYLRQALEVYERRQEVFYIALSKQLLARALHRMGRPQQALQLLAQVQRESASLGDSEILGRSLSTLARVLFDLGRGEEALQAMDEGIAVWGRLNNDAWEGGLMADKGWYLLELGRPRRARAELERALEVIEPLGDQYTLNHIYLLLAMAEEKLGDLEQAVLLYRKYQRLQQDFEESESRARMEELQARYESVDKSRVIADLGLKQALRRAELAREGRLRQSLLILAVLLLGLSAVVGLAYRWQLRRRLELQQAYSRLGAAHKALEVHSAEIRELVREKEELFALAAHDLRSPVVNIRGFSEELRHALAEVSDVLRQEPPNEVRLRQAMAMVQGELPEDLEHIRYATQRLEALVDGLLRLYRLSRNELDLVPVDVGELTSALLSGFAYEIEQAGADVHIESLPLVTADPAALETIFSNLLHNAIKYLDPSRPGRIEVRCEQRRGETVFHVEDNGRGIAPEDLERVFKVFSRVGPKEVAGEGIGLAAVRTLVRRHGGFIWCNSQLGEGSTFSFSLPSEPLQPTVTVPLRRSA